MSSDLYLSSATKRFQYYKELADKTFSQLTDDDFYFLATHNSNSIAIIIHHMHGNMMSRWTDFLTTDGEKEWRLRDEEFESQLVSTQDLLDLWEIGWQRLFQTLHTLTTDDLGKTVFIRDEPHSVIDAINRQIAHYAYHVGQIVYIGKMIRSDEWGNLSMPKRKI